MTRNLSVVIPTKDRPLLVRSAVHSALKAISAADEVIVVDDRSSVHVRAVLEDVFDSRLRLIDNQNSPGPSGARNYGVRNAVGRTILFLDDDDLMHPGYPEHVMRLRTANPTASYGFSSIKTFQDQHEIEKLPTYPIDLHSMDIATLRPFRRRLAGLGCGFWIDRNKFFALKGIAEDILVNEDTEFSIRLMAEGEAGVFSTYPGVAVRQHRAPVRNGDLGHLTHRTDAKRRAEFFSMILDRHYVWLRDQPEARRHLMQRHLKLLAQCGDESGACKAIASHHANGLRLALKLYFKTNLLLEKLRHR